MARGAPVVCGRVAVADNAVLGCGAIIERCAFHELLYSAPLGTMDSRASNCAG